MEIKLEQEDAADWVYRGEGAANLVLSYTGSSPLFIGKVMRIQKVARNGSSHCMEDHTVLTEHERLLWKEAEELVSSPTKELAELHYVKDVMSPLLGPKHVDAGMHVLACREFLESVEKKVICQRPAWRVDAAKIDVKCDFVLLMTDHSLFPSGIVKVGPCISAEIKPKCGFLPFSRFIAERNAVKRSTTRFRMHQVLKLRQHEISELSQYDPLDIFSGSNERIHKALNDLYSTPQNNFRVFLNGSIIFGGLGGGTDKSSIVIEKAFEGALKGVIQADDGLRTRSFIELVAETVYNSRCWISFLKELDEARVPHGYASLHSIPLSESLKIVKDYLIAATAKDCSLMVSFKPREDRDFGSPYGSVYLKSTNQNFDYKVNFIDLDLKPLKKMETYYEKDKKILNSYAQLAETKHMKGNTLSMESDCMKVSKTDAWAWFKSGSPAKIEACYKLKLVASKFCIQCMSEKTVVSVELLCSKCRQKVMKLIATIEGITSIVLDPSKNTVTVIGEADPVKIINKVRKFRRSATILSIGPAKEEKKEDKDSLKKEMIVKEMIVPYAPRACQRCDVCEIEIWDFSLEMTQMPLS
ncbi:hypothetical protein GH714_000027 [Hevea brasiliensis]|uniref:Inositol-pentakisphosphate 2-kinase n=1 Tax=Hevea brasiliensis TaxID=3981 RepID=A0A6A6KYW3_HEVBR|nr:hypothetical protein GH714_000027 [Hevea brasiliensis]